MAVVGPGAEGGGVGSVRGLECGAFEGEDPDVRRVVGEDDGHEMRFRGGGRGRELDEQEAESFAVQAAAGDVVAGEAVVVGQLLTDGVPEVFQLFGVTERRFVGDHARAEPLGQVRQDPMGELIVMGSRLSHSGSLP